MLLMILMMMMIIMMMMINNDLIEGDSSILTNIKLYNNNTKNPLNDRDYDYKGDIISIEYYSF